MLVSICVITYNRPQGLKRLLKGLNKLTFDKVLLPQIEVIIVENSTKGIAQQVIATIKNDFQWPLKTDIEPKRGISYARNKCLSLASPETDFIAMVDDDEVPKPNWLEELLLIQQQHNADIVTGPAISYLPKNTPSWIVKGGFFEREHHPTGEIREIAYTNNVLIRGEIIRKLDRIFDTRFALTGGEDSELFMRLYSYNYKIVWADEAVVEERVSPSRTNLSWILKCGYRAWSTHSLLEKEFYPSPKVQLLRILKGSTLIFLGFLQLIPGIILGKHKLASSFLYICRGAGTFAGLLGIDNYQVYKKSAEIIE
jgi:succinoglycan biosynthesis protein ExoM